MVGYIPGTHTPYNTRWIYDCDLSHGYIPGTHKPYNTHWIYDCDLSHPLGLCQVTYLQYLQCLQNISLLKLSKTINMHTGISCWKFYGTKKIQTVFLKNKKTLHPVYYKLFILHKRAQDTRCIMSTWTSDGYIDLLSCYKERYCCPMWYVCVIL